MCIQKHDVNPNKILKTTTKYYKGQNKNASKDSALKIQYESILNYLLPVPSDIMMTSYIFASITFKQGGQCWIGVTQFVQ